MSMAGEPSMATHASAGAQAILEPPPENPPNSPLNELQFWLPLIAVCASFILVGLDSTIVAIAVPTMTQYFGTVSDVGWYTSVYRLTAGSFQFLFGKLYGLFPAKTVLLASLAIFVGGSLSCALAPSSIVFIFGRAVTGLASAGIISGAFAIIIQTTTLRRRSTFAGIGGATEAGASLAAPLIGGILTDRLSWRWCFFMELPLVGTAFLLILLFLRTPRDLNESKTSLTAKIQAMDLLSTVLFVPSLGSLILGLQWGGSKYEWSSWQVVTAFAAFPVLFTAFAYLQYRRQDSATIPPRIFLQRSVLSGVAFSSCNNAALSIIEYYMPIYLQIVEGYSAARSGILVLPIAIGLILSVSLSGIMTSHFGYYNPFMLMTSFIAPIATGLLTTLGIRPPLWKLIVFQALLGCGAGIGFQGPQVAIQAIFSEKDSQIGIAIIQFAQGIGPAIFLSAAQSIFSARLDANVRNYHPGAGLLEVSNAQDEQNEDLVRGFANAFTQTFYLPLALACMTLTGALTIEWRSVKSKKP